LDFPDPNLVEVLDFPNLELIGGAFQSYENKKLTEIRMPKLQFLAINPTQRRICKLYIARNPLLETLSFPYLLPSFPGSFKSNQMIQIKSNQQRNTCPSNISFPIHYILIPFLIAL